MPRGSQPPLDVPMRDSGPVPKDQLRKLADIFMNDMGMSPEEVLQKPEFVEQGITSLRQLDEQKVRQIVRSILLEQSWRIQTDLNGIWAHDDSGQSRRLLPTEADPSIRAFLIEAVERQEAMMESLGRISERMDTLEAGR